MPKTWTLPVATGLTIVRSETTDGDGDLSRAHEQHETAGDVLMFASTVLKIDFGVPRGNWSDRFGFHFGKDRAMLGRDRCGGVRRREFLGAGTAAVATSLPLVETMAAAAQDPKSAAAAQDPNARRQQDCPQRASGDLGSLAPIRAGSSKSITRAWSRMAADREAIRATLDRGLVNLTGAEHPVEAWRTFVSPGEAVGIKVVPNGYPGAHTSPELVLEVIAGLKSAGIKRKDMVVFDRYLREFLTAGYEKIFPDGVAWGGLTPGVGPGTDDHHVRRQRPDRRLRPRRVRATHARRLADKTPKDDRCFRSHLGKIVTSRLDKIICLPCLKDHHAAGATGALKNMSHGLVNNVFRSHSSPDGIAMVTFIPAVVSHPIIRANASCTSWTPSRGVWEGGPYGKNPDWLWDYNALLLPPTRWRWTTSSWDILDAKRKQMGVPGVGAVGRLAADPFKHEGYDIRQPQYIAIAGQLGLGNFDKKSPSGRRFSIDHRVSSVV